MTCACARTAGADDAIAAAYLAAQRMRNLVADCTGVARDNVTVVAHFLAYGFPAFLRLGQRAQSE